MASIRLERNERVKAFANLLALEIGARVEFWGTSIVIEGMDKGNLVIPRWCFDQAMAGDNKEWRSIVMYRVGEAEVNQNLIVVRNPVEGKRGFLLRFEDLEEKERVRRFADRLGYKSMRAFILEAIREEMERWRREEQLMGVYGWGGERET